MTLAVPGGASGPAVPRTGRQCVRDERRGIASVKAAGARALATTSAGVSWALGRPDGQGLTREAMVDAVRRMVGAVRVPVTADIESGYGAGMPDDVAATVRGVLAAGAVGVHLLSAAKSSYVMLLTKPTASSA